MNKKEKLIVSGTLALFCVPAMFSYLNPETSSANFENRAALPFPAVPTSLNELYKWPLQLDDFLENRVCLRNTIIRSYSEFVYNSFGLSINSNVVVGRNDWLYISESGHAIDKHRGIYTFTDEKQKSEWIQNLNQLAMFVQGNNADLIFVIVPSKPTIYPDYLPEHLTVVGPTLTDSIVEMLQKEAQFEWVDLRPVLIQAAKQEQVFFKHDTHWNVRGSYLGYVEVMNHIADRHCINFLDATKVSFKQRLKKGGDLARLLGLETEFYEQVPDVTIMNSIVISKTGEDYRTHQVVVETSKKQLAKALVLCDSFVFSSMSLYLQESFSSIIYKHHESLNFERSIIEETKPNIVLLMVTERLLPVALKNKEI